jgi:hypothetical protein
MKALVTGLSASKYYSPKYDLTVGVNDCPFPVDHLIICDHPRIFRPERLDVIKDHPGWLFTHIRDWSHVRQAEMIVLSDKRSDVSMIYKKERYAHSISSPFIAVVHAFYCGATEVHLAGVDLNGHPHLGQPHNIMKCQDDFKALDLELRKNGCELKLIRSIPHGALFPVLSCAYGFEFVE